jgi:hypothetical protein
MNFLMSVISLGYTRSQIESYTEFRELTMFLEEERERGRTSAKSESENWLYRNRKRKVWHAVAPFLLRSVADTRRLAKYYLVASSTRRSL